MEHTARCRALHADLDRVGDAYGAALVAPDREHRVEEIHDMGRRIGAIHVELDDVLAACPACLTGAGA